MAKEQTSVWLKLLTVLLIIYMILMVLSWFERQNQNKRLDLIEIQLKSIPKRVCHIEEHTEQVNITSFCLISGNQTIWWLKNPYYLSDSQTFKCVDGVKHYEYFNILVNYDCEPKLCLITTQKEVCEIK
jgi:hypothetical protein